MAMPPKFLEHIVILCVESGIPGKIAFFAYNETFWPSKIFGLATLLPPTATVMCTYSACKEPTTVNAMCKYSTFKGPQQQL